MHQPKPFLLNFKNTKSLYHGDFIFYPFTNSETQRKTYYIIPVIGNAPKVSIERQRVGL